MTSLWFPVVCALFQFLVPRSSDAVPLPVFTQRLSAVDATEIQFIREDGVESRDRRSASTGEGLPGYRVRLLVDGDWVTLNLTQDRNAVVQIPLYEWRGDHVFKQNQSAIANRKLYVDPATGACILLHVHPRDPEVIRMFGTFYVGSTHYSIQPHTSADEDLLDVDADTALSVSAKHVVMPTVKMDGFRSNALPTSKDGLKYRALPRRPSRIRRQLDENDVELLVVVDHAVYERFYSQTSSGLSADMRSSEAGSLITQYYAYVIGAMNIRYEDVAGTAFNIRVLAAGIVITKTRSQSTWVVNNIVSGDLVEATDVIDDFTAWSANTDTLPSRDHTMLFTGYNVTSGGNPHSTGIAWVEAICSDNSTSVVEESFNFFSATTAAHELGHSLGAGHDGTGNTCSQFDNYIMSSLNSINEEPRLTRNLWRFSSCSVSAFQTVLNRLNTNGDNCLKGQSVTSRLPDTSVPAGTVYSPDASCEFSNGAGSSVCRTLQQLDQICTSMLCSKPGTNYCTFIMAAEGTSCGSGKWCSKGYCVSSPLAPAIDESCPFGDQPGVVTSGQTCAQLIRGRPDYCYQDFYQRKCCASCSAIAVRSRPDCLYGDKDVNFCSSIDRYNCYFQESVCCGTCQRLKNVTLPGCEFGDRLIGCTTPLCGQLATDCCETCATSTVAPPTTTTSSTTTTTTTTTRSTTTTTTTTRTTTTTTTAARTTKSTTTTTTTTTSTTRSSTATSTTTKPTKPPTTIITTMPSAGTSDTLVIGLGAAAGVVLVIIIAILVCFIRRRRAAKSDQKQDVADAYDNIGFVPSAKSPIPSHPPPRRGGGSIISSVSQGVPAPNYQRSAPFSQPSAPPSHTPPRRGDSSFTPHPQFYDNKALQPDTNGVAFQNDPDKRSDVDLDGYMTPSEVDFKIDHSKPKQPAQSPAKGRVVYRKPLKPPGDVMQVALPDKEKHISDPKSSFLQVPGHSNMSLSPKPPSLPQRPPSAAPRPTPPRPLPRNRGNNTSETGQATKEVEVPPKPMLPVKPSLKPEPEQDGHGGAGSESYRV